MRLDESARVSVIVPARNEEANIARVVRSLAQQEGVREIIVVDDQSSDRTGEILSGLKSEVSLLRILRVEELPEGWVGKTHAASVGAREATGEWLLFTDADTEHLPGSLAELVQQAEEERADLLSISPGQETPTWWEKSVIPMVFVKLAELFRFEEVSNPKSPAAAANGQYLLVRREIYQRSGGHEAVKAEILEDVELARRIKLLGGKLVFLPGARWVRTRMYRTFGEMWQGWTKNLFLLYQGNTGKMLAAVASLWLLDLLPEVAFVASCVVEASTRAGRVPALCALGFFLVAVARQWNYGSALVDLGYDSLLTSYLPVGAALLGALLLNSLRVHRSTGHIQWKGRHYAAKGKG